MPLPLQSTPPPITAPAPSGAEALEALLEAFDWGHPLPLRPKLKGQAALTYEWLRRAATFDPTGALPVSPFLSGRERREAEALRRLPTVPRAQLTASMKALSPREAGTALALWRWGQAQVRAGAFDRDLRQVWEDQLLSAGPALTRGYALRHALCWALAEQDEARFARLRPTADPASEAVHQTFQGLFGLLGGPSPTLRLWALPGLAYRDLSLKKLGGRIWVCPLEEGPVPTLPSGTAWIIPSASGALDERDASLPEPLLAEGRALAQRLQLSGATASFAASRPAFERIGLLWFPILIELDSKGGIRSIRMGDAAPDRP